MERRQQYPPEFITKHGQQILFDKTIIPLVLNIDLDVIADVKIVDPPNMIKVVSANGIDGILLITCTEPNVIHIVKDEIAATFKLAVNDAVTGVELAVLPAGVSHATVYSVPTVVPTARPKTVGELAYEGEVKRSVIDSVSGKAIGQSSIYEDLKYKHIIEPYVNDPDVEHGYVDINDNSPAPFSIARITIRKPTDTTTPDQWTMAVDADAEEFAFNVPESGRAYSIDCVAGTTLSELIDLLEADAGFVSMFFINIKEVFDGTKIVGTCNATNFTGGAAGHVVTSTGAEIDATVDAVASYTPTGTDLGTDVGTLWTDVKADTTGLLDRTTALETTIDTETTGLVDRMKAAEDDIDDLEAVAPTSGAPQTTQVAATATYDKDKITFTAEVGEDGNDISVEATCQLSATLGAGTTEFTLVGANGLYNGGDTHLVSAQIVQGVGVEVPLGLVNTAGVIVITLPTDEAEDAVDVTITQLFSLIGSEMNTGGELDGTVSDVNAGASCDGNATAITTTAIPFTADTNTVVDDGNTVTIYLAYDGTNFDNWDDVVTAIAEESTLVTASAGAESEAGPFAAIKLEGGLDITTGVSGAIRYEATKIWISVDDSTATESNWKSADLTDPNA